MQEAFQVPERHDEEGLQVLNRIKPGAERPLYRFSSLNSGQL